MQKYLFKIACIIYYSDISLSYQLNKKVMSYATKVKKVVNGKVQEIYEFTWTPGKSAENKQIWLINNGWSERSAYMIAFNISESEMKRIENS